LPDTAGRLPRRGRPPKVDPEREATVRDARPGTDPAQQWADDTGDPEHRAEEVLVAAALAGRHDVADDRLGRDHQAAGAQPLHRPEEDQLDHVLADPGEHGANEEQDDSALE
jgi:hypothetical protein